MDKVVREETFETAVVQYLVREDGYRPVKAADYDADLCLVPEITARFFQVSQPEQWKAYREIKGADAARALCRRIREVIDRRGTLHALNKGVDESGHHFDLCYMPPASGPNPELKEKFEANFFQVMRQCAYERVPATPGKPKALDLVIFLNGLPLFTLELKNKQTGQLYTNAIRQYRKTRDPKEPLFRFGRCLAHFAMDNHNVYMATALEGDATEFLPFNQGYDGGAGNPPRGYGFATAYLWEEVLRRENVMDLVLRFMRIVKKLDRKGRDTGKLLQIFPRYHQWQTVRRLTEHAGRYGAGYAYLNQHSAGSGKTIEIATLANSLATLHDANDKVVFKTVIILSDRRVIDRQLQRALEQFTPTRGMLENIDRTSRQLKAALQDGKKIIVSTIQKFPEILDDLHDLPSTSFAVIIDEAHSSQAGEAAGVVNQVLSYGKLEDVKEEDDQTWEDKIEELLARRGRMKHVSFFAFTATPKDETLQLFKTETPDGKSVAPFTLYTMRQAIEEHFILDVLKNYVTYNQYFHLLKTIEADPRYEKNKAVRLLRKLVTENPTAIERKAKIIVEHFLANVAGAIGGRAKAMVVTRSRLHAVRTFLAIRDYLEARKAPFKALVAFTGTVKDEERDMISTEAGLNGFSETKTADRFDTDDYRIMVVANKFQTGFDQPLLQTMYLDRRIAGVMAVQTLSRLNRTHPGKDAVMVLDFENQAGTVRKAFQQYYDRVQLREEVEPNVLYNIRNDLDDFKLYDQADVDAFCRARFSRLKDVPKREKLEGLIVPVVASYKQMEKPDRKQCKSLLRDYVKCYAFLSQLVPFQDPRLEKHYHYARFLVRSLPVEGGELPTEILEQVDLSQYKPEYLGEETLTLERGAAEIRPKNYGAGAGGEDHEKDALSVIIEELNNQFGTDFTPDDQVVIRELETRLDGDDVLAQRMLAGSRDAARLSFEQVAQDLLFDLMDENFRFYKKVQDDEDVARLLYDRLFERYCSRKEPARGQDV